MITRFARLVTALSIFDYRHHAMIPSPRVLVLTIPGAMSYRYTMPIHALVSSNSRPYATYSALFLARPFLTELSYAFVIIARLASSMCRGRIPLFAAWTRLRIAPPPLFMMQQSENWWFRWEGNKGFNKLTALDVVNVVFARKICNFSMLALWWFMLRFTNSSIALQ